MTTDSNVAFLSNKEQAKQLPQTSAAWSDSLLYSGASFPRYNPDDLIGRKGFGIYSQMMNDEQLKAVVRFRRDSITGREYGFEFPDNVTLSEDEQTRRIAILEAAVMNLKGSFKDSLNKILASIYQGFSMTEKIFGLFEYEGKQYWGIEALSKKPFETFYFVTDEFGNLDRVYQEMGGRQNDIDIDSMIHHVQNIDEDEQYGKSELREAYRSWFSKDVIIKFRNIHLERHASGFLWIGETEEGSMPAAGTPDHQALINIVNNFQVKTGMLLPAGLEAHLEKPNSTDAFEKAINHEDKALAKALLMPNLMGFSEDGGVGSQAKSQTQLEAFLWILDSEAIGLEETVNEQLFRGLSEVNFGDGIYPRFKFKPLSKAMLQTIATTWGDLVDKKAVTHTNSDEAHLRNLMDFPPTPEVDEDGNKDSSLAGELVTPMLEVITQVAKGLMPWETGVLILVNSFPLNKEKAEELLEKIPKDLYDPTKQPEDNSDGTSGNDNKPDIGSDNGGSDGGNNLNDSGEGDETILGTDQTAIEYTRQLRRVNFSEIDRSSEIIINEGTNALGTVINDIILFFDNEIKTKELYGENTDPDVVNDLVVPSSLNKRLQKEAEKFMRDAWELGVTQGKQEIGRAGNGFARKSKMIEFKKLFGTLTDGAVSYFDTRAFVMAGKLSTGTMDVIKGSILNGIKYSKTQKQIKDDIYAQLASYGYLNIEDVESALGQALEISNPTARLMTTVRTSTFEAINEARFSYFTDKTLNGFVKALEYSSILDSVTTPICRDLDERIYQLDSTEWNRYRPPNHFNCRSLLIPVTKDDIFVETTRPHNAEPAQGFG